MSESKKAPPGIDRCSNEPPDSNWARCDDDSAITDWIIQHPETAEVFHRLGLEVTCAGISLASACQRHGLPLGQVHIDLLRAIGQPPPVPTERG